MAEPIEPVKEEAVEDAGDLMTDLLKKGRQVLLLFFILMLYSTDIILKYVVGWADGTRDGMALTMKGELIKNIMVVITWVLLDTIISVL